MIGRELVAWNVRKLRAAKGISQERLAADAGIARGYMGDIERASRAATVDILDRLATALGVETAVLLRTPEAGEASPEALPRGRRPA
jgi:transcriptional regulator with XRE-family HTH domain